VPVNVISVKEGSVVVACTGNNTLFTTGLVHTVAADAAGSKRRSLRLLFMVNPQCFAVLNIEIIKLKITIRFRVVLEITITQDVQPMVGIVRGTWIVRGHEH